MIDACTPAGGPASLARDVLASTDCFLGTKVEQGYAILLAPGGSFANLLTIALTIYVAIYGYRLILGQASLTLGEVVPHFVKIGIIIAMVSNWPTYQLLVFNLLFNGPQQVAGLIMAKTGGGGIASQNDVLSALQALFDRITGHAGDYWAQTPAAATPSTDTSQPPLPMPSAAETMPGGLPPGQVSGAPPGGVAARAAVASPFALGAPQFVAMALWFSALLMMASSVGVLLVVRIILTVLLIVGPLFIAMALFRATRGVAEGWLRVAVKFALVPMLVLPLTAILVSVLATFVVQLPDEIETFQDSPALAILMIVLVFAAVLLQALGLADTMAGSIRLPRGTRATPGAADIERAAPLQGSGAASARRADLIVQSIPMGMAAGAASAQRSEALTSVRVLDMAPASGSTTTDMTGRLGQSNRRQPPRTGFAADMRTRVK